MVEIGNEREVKVRFNDLGEADRQRTIREHMKAFNLEAPGNIEDLFIYANPRLQMCDSKDAKYYVIHSESHVTMKLLSKRFLLSEK